MRQETEGFQICESPERSLAPSFLRERERWGQSRTVLRDFPRIENRRSTVGLELNLLPPGAFNWLATRAALACERWPLPAQGVAAP